MKMFSKWFHPVSGSTSAFVAGGREDHLPNGDHGFVRECVCMRVCVSVCVTRSIPNLNTDLLNPTQRRVAITF